MVNCYRLASKKKFFGVTTCVSVKAGRGDRHMVPCPGLQRHEHEGCLHSNKDDLVRHDLFWSRMNFADPYKEKARAVFIGCPAVCTHRSHIEKEPVHCSGNPDHKSFKPADLMSNFHNAGFLSHDSERDGPAAGHHFPCIDHKCGDRDNRCQMQNQKWQTPGCLVTCSQLIGRSGSCKRDSNKHPCQHRCAGELCDANCVRFMEDSHSTNQCKCAKTACLRKCEICNKERCHKTKDHLHRVPDKDGSHLHHCGREHRCQQLCEASGVCGKFSTE